MRQKLTFEDLELKYKELRAGSFTQRLPLESSQWFKLLKTRALDALPAGVAVLDENFNLRHQNRAYADYLKIYSPIGPQRALGTCYFDYMPGSRSQLEAWFRETRDAGRFETKYDYELQLNYEKEKQTTYWDASVIPLLSPARHVTGIAIVCLDVTGTHRVLEALNRKRAQLKIVAHKLEDAKAGLRALLDLKAETKKEAEEKLSLNVHSLLLPLVAQLKSSRLNPGQRTLLNFIESTLAEITSGFSRELSSPAWGLTPREILVAGLIKGGKTSKEIAAMLLVSPASIEFHRGNIRKKLGLTHQRTNLRAYLAGM